MQSGYGVSEFQQLLVDGCSSLLSMSHDISSSSQAPKHHHLQQEQHQQQQQQHHPHHHQRFFSLHQNSAPPPPQQMFFQHPLQFQLLQQQHQRRLYQQLGLDHDSAPEHSNSSSRVIDSGGGLPFFLANFKLPDESSGSRGAVNDDDSVLCGSDSRVAAATATAEQHHSWQNSEENPAPIKESFWTPLDTEYINRNNKRCKEKIEVCTKFANKSDKQGTDVEETKNSGSNYGLFGELEAIYTHGSGSGGGACNNQTGSGSALTGDNPPTAVAEPRAAGHPRGGVDHGSETSAGEEASLIRKHKRRKKRKQLSAIACFFENMVKQLMDHQESLHRKFLDVMEKRDEERTRRDEAWRRQEMARSNEEAMARGQEHALASSREAAIVAFLEKITGETITLPTKNSTSTVDQIKFQAHSHEANSHKNENASGNQQSTTFNSNKNHIPSSTEGYYSSEITNSVGGNSRRWPKDEVHALIQVRSSLETRFQEPGLKGPLWEEVSSSMASMGYQRGAKRCKEKWENINKYFRKTKDSTKKRSQYSKTCPYFHQLDQLYSKTSTNPKLLLSSNASAQAKDHHLELLDSINTAQEDQEHRFDGFNEDASANARNEGDDDEDEGEEDDHNVEREEEEDDEESTQNKLYSQKQGIRDREEPPNSTLFFSL